MLELSEHDDLARNKMDGHVSQLKDFFILKKHRYFHGKQTMEPFFNISTAPYHKNELWKE